MARIYAGILGPLAFLTCLARGMMHGGGTESVLWTAWCCLWLFATVGYVLGWIGQQTIEDAVRSQLVARLNAERSGETDYREGSPATGA